MSLVSLADDIATAQLERGARGYISPFIFPTRHTLQLATPHEREAVDQFGMTPRDWEGVRQLIKKADKEWEERSAREHVLVYKYNKERTEATCLGYMTKAKAVKVVRFVAGGELLDLDNRHGGILAYVGHLYISEAKLADGISRYGTDISVNDLVGKLLDECAAERRVAA